MATYQHSESFAKLKNINEGTDTNYTTYQWLHTLDFFIESALDPMATAYPDFMDNYFAKVVAWQTTRPSVKFTRNHKDTLASALFNSITTEGAEKRKHQKSMLLNRGILFGAIASYLQTVNTYMQLHSVCGVYSSMPSSRRKLLIALAEERVGSEYLHAATLQTMYWAQKAYDFKALIVKKYVRLAIMNAKRTYADVKFVIRLNDIIQTYLVFLSKAIDRCDSRQGVLTTFIQTWFYSARAETHKAALEEQHSSYEDMVESGLLEFATQPDSNFEAVQHIAALAKTLDPSGAIRYSLGIPEFFTTHDLKILSTATKDN